MEHRGICQLQTKLLRVTFFAISSLACLMMVTLFSIPANCSTFDWPINDYFQFM